MSQFYTFIAAKTTYQAVVPTGGEGQAKFNRKVRNALAANQGGAVQVGNLLLRPTSDAVPNHLLCDGSAQDQSAFPELFAYLGDSQGAAAVGKFLLPDFVGTFTPTATVPEQTTTGGTVSTGGTVTTPTQPGQTGGTSGGNIPSGGRRTDGGFYDIS